METKISSYWIKGYNFPPFYTEQVIHETNTKGLPFYKFNDQKFESLKQSIDSSDLKSPLDYSVSK